jgi:hypothetical protein
MNNKDYAIYNEHFINPKNNIYYKIYNNDIELFDNINTSNNEINESDSININNNIIAQGKQVILVDSDNPWYVNVSADKIPAIYKKIDFDKIRGFSGQRHTADFNSIMSENNYKNLISTYSLKDKLNKLTQIEAFSNIDNNYIYYLIIIIVLTIILFRYTKNK